MATDTRDRIIQRSSELFRRHGFAATGIKQIVAEARAPFGSVYHFFPDGKEQLGAEVIRWSGGIYGQLLDAYYPPGADLVAATRAFFAGAAQTLRDTDYADACPIATIALEVSSSSEPMREACAEVFQGWTDRATDRFAAGGLPRRRARELAITLLSALEGAFVLARAQRSTEPLEVAGRATAATMRDALAAGRARAKARARR
jgi:AcrR family transcriptional regulator